MRKKVVLIVLIMIISLFFLDNVFAETYNNYTSATVSCGDKLVTGIPKVIPKIVSIAYTIIQVAVPVVLVIMGSLDLFKGISAQKEDEIKKGQQTFIKRMISAVLVFFVFVIVKVVISLAADSTGARILKCTHCFIENDCDTGFLDKIKDTAQSVLDKVK